MTKLVRAAVLVLAFSAYAFADDGIMQNDKNPPPPPPPSGVTQSSEEPVPTLEGIMRNDLTAAAEVSLSLLQNLVALY
ncbi:MAG: hypothetical protein ACJ741_21585 [Pyrinomonadaceae bacterium]